MGYEQGDAEGRFIPSSRNGSYPKIVSTIGRDIELQVPRADTFVPALVLKGFRRPGDLDEMIVSLHAGA